jgi:hypothetical protein
VQELLSNIDRTHHTLFNIPPLLYRNLDKPDMTPEIKQMITMNTAYTTAYPSSDITFLVNMTHTGLHDQPIIWTSEGLIQERNRVITTLEAVYE